MITNEASLTAQARYKQILAELAELYERRERLKQEQLGQAVDGEAPAGGRPALVVLIGGRDRSVRLDYAHRRALKARLTVIPGGLLQS